MSLDHQTKMRVLYAFMGTLTGVHTHLDDLRHLPKDSVGAMGAAAGTPEYAADYNIEMAQQALEVATMRLQQVVALSDREVCTPSAPPCSDEAGPCPKHAEAPA